MVSGGFFMIIHGSRLVFSRFQVGFSWFRVVFFMVIYSSMLVFHGSIWRFMFFMVPGRFFMVFMVFFMIPGGFLWFFMIPGRFFHDSRSGF